MKRRRRHGGDNPSLTGAAFALILGVAILAGMAEAALRVLMPRWQEFYSGRFIELGHVPGHGPFAIGRAGFDGWFSQNNGDFRSHIRLNESGLRNDEPVGAADGRIWVIGDSMTFGWGVERDQMYSSALAAAGYPTYNVASPGTDLCGYQALYDRMPAHVRPGAVVLGLILENDMANYDCAGRAAAAAARAAPEPDEAMRLIDVKMALTHHSALYNFFAVAVKRVDVVNQALQVVGLVNPTHVEHHHRTASEMDSVVGKTADAVLDLQRKLPEGTPFVVLVVPTRFEIRDQDASSRQLRESVLVELARRGIATVDPLPAFLAAGFAPTHFAHDGHWSPLGHKLAAEALTQWLAANVQETPQ
ncbi:hypothetical protein [Magnetospirillum sp. UT-4]|uniref:alginate O-acetyltransferase AlgX-related protein n=1 Tax=Magnetospirillum sp. UT-4 TaxID=2681467 RepID=UPI001380FE0B|nr:hypothetical protein [Magnetospirillum sp. UT-4]CAA7621769.1 conserved exported hypothetical protein [Magnetospirillum sp. UT-4]